MLINKKSTKKPKIDLLRVPAQGDVAVSLPKSFSDLAQEPSFIEQTEIAKMLGISMSSLHKILYYADIENDKYYKIINNKRHYSLKVIMEVIRIGKDV